MERDVIPTEQLERLIIERNPRGYVKDAKVKATLLKWCIAEEILEPEAEYYYNCLLRMRQQDCGGVKAANLDGIQRGGSDVELPYMALVKIMGQDLEPVLMMGEKEACDKWKPLLVSNAGQIREAFRKLKVFIDELEEL